MKKVNKKYQPQRIRQQMIVELPFDTDYDSLPDETKEVLKPLMISNIQLLHGTTMVTSKVLVLCLVKESENATKQIFSDLFLDWDIVAYEDSKITQSKLLPYFPDDIILTPAIVDGEEVMIQTEEPVIELEGRLPLFSGHKWIFN